MLRLSCYRLSDQQASATAQSSNTADPVLSRQRPVFRRFESAPSTHSQPVAIVNGPQRTRLRSETSLTQADNSAWTQPF